MIEIVAKLRDGWCHVEVRQNDKAVPLLVAVSDVTLKLFGTSAVSVDVDEERVSFEIWKDARSQGEPDCRVAIVEGHSPFTYYGG
jgi:hypothetical protein